MMATVGYDPQSASVVVIVVDFRLILVDLKRGLRGICIYADVEFFAQSQVFFVQIISKDWNPLEPIFHYRDGNHRSRTM
jgi:hypothetical protein